MGDRANIVILEEDFDNVALHAVFLYGHWMGQRAPEILKAALRRAIADQRSADSSYLGRVIFCEMVRDDLDGTTGYGISAQLQDNDWPLLVVDPRSGRVTEYPESMYNEVGWAGLAGFQSEPFGEYSGAWFKTAGV